LGSNGRALSLLVIQLLLLAAAVYVGVSDAAFPGASTLARGTIVVLCVAVSFLAGEVARLRTDFGVVLKALQVNTVKATPRDDRAAIDVLVAALDSGNLEVREKAHVNLVRITGQNLPPDGAPWKAWWASARDGFTRQGS